ncbi:MAG: hypothetical protein NVSMB17_12840 [Candidatus Dormibacteria bacterium]
MPAQQAARHGDQDDEQDHEEVGKPAGDDIALVAGERLPGRAEPDYPGKPELLDPSCAAVAPPFERPGPVFRRREHSGSYAQKVTLQKWCIASPVPEGGRCRPKRDPQTVLDRGSHIKPRAR